MNDLFLVFQDHTTNDIFTTTSIVAQHTGKRHDNVVQMIDKLLKTCSKNNRLRLNFQEQVVKVYSSGQYRHSRIYAMDRRSFAVLMGKLGGDKALEWSLDFYDAFDAMESQLNHLQATKAQALELKNPCLAVVLTYPTDTRQQQIDRMGRKSVSSATYYRHQAKTLGLKSTTHTSAA